MTNILSNKTGLQNLFLGKMDFSPLPPELSAHSIVTTMISSVMNGASPEDIAKNIFDLLPPQLQTQKNESDVLHFVEMNFRSASSVSQNKSPNRNLKLSSEGLKFIMRFEGFRSQLYNDDAGHATIGYGHLVHKGKINGSEPQEFKNSITQERAMQLLQNDVESATNDVRRLVKILLTQSQFDALVSFTFNLGGNNLASSTLLKKINAKDFAGAQKEISRWHFSNDLPSNGLKRRRAEEIELFSSDISSSNR